MSVREGLLALMSHGPRHGYQLKTEFEAATGGVWSLNVGQVYTTLERLDRAGLVAVDVLADDRGEQKRYSLTAEGREALGAWWETVPAEEPPPRDELQLKVLLAIEQGVEHALRVITHQRTALVRLLQQHRREARDAAWRPAGVSRGRRGPARRTVRAQEGGMHGGGIDRAAPAAQSPAGGTDDAGRDTGRSHDGAALAAELVADALTVRAEADLRWLDLCEARLLRARTAADIPGDRS